MGLFIGKSAYFTTSTKYDIMESEEDERGITMKLVEKAMQKRVLDSSYGDRELFLDIVGILVSLYRVIGSNARKFLRMVVGGVIAIAFGYVALYIISIGIVHF